MSKIKLLFIIVTVIMIISLAFNAYQLNTNLSLTKQSNEETELIIINSEAAINAELRRLDKLLSNACQQLSTKGLTGPEAKQILSRLYTENSDIIISSATTDKNDVILAIQPNQYSNLAGQDLKSQEHNIEMHKTLRTAVSNLDSLIEGSIGVAMVSPVFDTNKQLIGSLRITFQPYQLIHPL